VLGHSNQPGGPERVCKTGVFGGVFRVDLVFRSVKGELRDLQEPRPASRALVTS